MNDMSRQSISWYEELLETEQLYMPSYLTMSNDNLPFVNIPLHPFLSLYCYTDLAKVTYPHFKQKG